MKRIPAIAALLATLISLSNMHASEREFAPGRIVTVEKKSHQRVLYYIVNTPIYQEDSYYELSLELGTTLYLTEYTPRHAADELPDGWQDDAEVQMKVTDKHHVAVRQQGGPELQLVIVKRTSSAVPLSSPKSPPVKN